MKILKTSANRGIGAALAVLLGSVSDLMSRISKLTLTTTVVFEGCDGKKMQF